MKAKARGPKGSISQARGLWGKIFPYLGFGHNKNHRMIWSEGTLEDIPYNTLIS